MTEAFNLLNAQPDSWPRWHPGAEVNGSVTFDRHLFLLELVGGDPAPFGRVYPACHFVDGARPVDYDRSVSNGDSPYLDHCNGCQEVELQHALTLLT